jgi:hypothetical protein
LEKGLVIAAGFSVLPLLASIAAIDVRSPGQCPSAADVAQRLHPILPQVPPGSPLATDVAAVEERPDGTLSLSLSRSTGGLVGRRELPRASSCADQADAVAVTLAVWEAALHPDITLALDRLPPDASRTSTPRLGPPQPSPPAAVVDTRAAAASLAREPGRFRVGAGFGVGQSLGGGNTFVPEAHVEGAWSLANDAWRLRLSAGGAGEHVMRVETGEAHWRRLSLAAAVQRVSPIAGASWKIVIGAGPVAGVVRLRGSGFAVDHSEVLADVGGAAAARLERRSGRWSAWLAVTVTYWLRSQQLEVIGASPGSSAVELPRGEAGAALGVSFAAL